MCDTKSDPYDQSPNYGLWLWYVNVSSSLLKIYTILVSDVDNEGGNACVAAGDIW